MQCSICNGSGPFLSESYVRDRSKPICDYCANAIRIVRSSDIGNAGWDSSCHRLEEYLESIQDESVYNWLAPKLHGARSEEKRQIKQNIAAYEAETERIAEIRKNEEEKRAAEERYNAEVSQYNPQYEYAIESISVNSNGKADIIMIKNKMDAYTQNSWRLHKMSTNEYETIMIFERCIKPLPRINNDAV